MNYSFLKKFSFKITTILECLFTLDTKTFNTIEHIFNSVNSLSYYNATRRPYKTLKTIADLRTCEIDQLNVNECLLNYVLRDKIHRPYNSLIENEMSIRSALSENINLMSYNKFLPSEELDCATMVDELMRSDK